MTPDPVTPQDDPEAPAMIRADLIAGLVFIALGLWVFYGSWTMDRLEVRRIQPLSAPGIVPGILSAALTLCGIILAIRSLRTALPGGWSQLGRALVSPAAGRAGVVMVLTLVYTLGMIGQMPFWLATGIFLFAFIMVFETWLANPRRPLAVSLPWALGIAIVISALVTFTFERAFLVRLP